jgi:hypothetical protein
MADAMTDNVIASTIDQRHPNSFEEWLDDMDLDRLLEEYDFAKMEPKERWEAEEQLDELEGFMVLEHLGSIQDEREPINPIDTMEQMEEEELQGSPIVESLSLLEDENEQLNPLHTIEQMDEQATVERTYEGWIQWEQWDPVAFLVQQ